MRNAIMKRSCGNLRRVFTHWCNLWQSGRSTRAIRRKMLNSKSKKLFNRWTEFAQEAKVGRCRLNPAEYRLERNRSQRLNIEYDELLSKLCFQFQLAPLLQGDARVVVTLRRQDHEPRPCRLLQPLGRCHRGGVVHNRGLLHSPTFRLNVTHFLWDTLGDVTVINRVVHPSILSQVPICEVISTIPDSFPKP